MRGVRNQRRQQIVSAAALPRLLFKIHISGFAPRKLDSADLLWVHLKEILLQVAYWDTIDKHSQYTFNFMFSYLFLNQGPGF